MAPSKLSAQQEPRGFGIFNLALPLLLRFLEFEFAAAATPPDRIEITDEKPGGVKGFIAFGTEHVAVADGEEDGNHPAHTEARSGRDGHDSKRVLTELPGGQNQQAADPDKQPGEEDGLGRTTPTPHLPD